MTDDFSETFLWVDAARVGRPPAREIVPTPQRWSVHRAGAPRPPRAKPLHGHRSYTSNLGIRLFPWRKLGDKDGDEYYRQ
jgi:hypothetical protein